MNYEIIDDKVLTDENAPNVRKASKAYSEPETSNISETRYVLEARGVCKRFGGVVATDNINISAARGGIYGIIGPNGAGKTTLFNMITGVYLPTEGDILFDGKSLVGMLPHQIARAGIARTFQNIRLFGDLTVYDNVRIAYQQNMTYGLFDGIFKTKKSRLQERECADMSAELLNSVDLWPYKDEPASNLPYGMQRRLEIVRALASSPKLLLLDEPAAGMNEDESERLSLLIRNIRDTRKGITILVIDHHMDVIMDVCDIITVINFGRQLATGTPVEIQVNQDVIDAYLGVGD